MIETLLEALIDIGRGIAKHFAEGGTARELQSKTLGEVTSTDALERVERANKRAAGFIEEG